MAFRSNKDAGLSGEYPLTYFLGSGHLGTTYLYEIDRYLFESPVAWYAASRSYDMKPGLAEMTEMPPPITMESSCLRCHMSAVQHSNPGSMNRYSGLPMNVARVQCMAGDATRARATIDVALVYAPGQQNLRRMRNQISECGASKSQRTAQRVGPLRDYRFLLDT
ncbi:MAG: hypothetical protein ACJ72H_15870 [Candidatus Sulfotelmatobacter sp.]